MPVLVSSWFSIVKTKMFHHVNLKCFFSFLFAYTVPIAFPEASHLPITTVTDSVKHSSILTGLDSFEFVYSAKIPLIEESASLWIPVATSDAFQEVELIDIGAPISGQTITDRDFGNQLLYFKLGKKETGSEIVLRYQVKRREKAPYVAYEVELANYLRPERLTPFHLEFKRLAEKAIGSKMGQREKARALYEHVIGRMRYDKSGIGWGRGDALYACDVKTGNCTDFHAYFIGLSRSVGIPTRFSMGATIPAEKDEGPVGGYHCWAEFYADGKWFPIDISEAWKVPSLADYYFGHHPANRIEFTRGRDLIVTPSPSSGPINFLIYPILEMQGKEQILIPSLWFKRL